MKIDSANKGGNWIERRLSRRGRGSKERVRNMARDQEAFDTQINPSGREIREVDPPFFLAFISVRLETKTINTVSFR